MHGINCFFYVEPALRHRSKPKQLKCSARIWISWIRGYLLWLAETKKLKELIEEKMPVKLPSSLQQEGNGQRNRSWSALTAHARLWKRKFHQLSVSRSQTLTFNGIHKVCSLFSADSVVQSCGTRFGERFWYHQRCFPERLEIQYLGRLQGHDQLWHHPSN